MPSTDLLRIEPILLKLVNEIVFQVRAHNLADLVYKQGQAGVSKATVTITFDNTDPKQTPIGYERCKEIIIRRQVRSPL